MQENASEIELDLETNVNIGPVYCRTVGGLAL